MKRVDKCCGGCTHFKYETTDGSGWCEVGDTKTYCGFGTDCNDFEDEETIRRHYTAVLIQANRYRRDNNVPSIYRMPNPRELGRAIDYAIKYMKGAAIILRGRENELQGAQRKPRRRYHHLENTMV